MAKIKAGILSKVSGKVAGVVGGTWKGQNYIRELVKPSNPNTALQQAQRGKMSFVVKLARQLVGDVLNPYLNKFCKTMSGYNWFCRENIGKSAGTPLALTSAPVLSFGTLGTGAIDYSNVTVGAGGTITALPKVEAGHSLEIIGAAITTTGEVLGIYTKKNPTVSSDSFGDIVLADGEYTFYIVNFFADYDANGVLSQISASLASPVTTETVSG